MREALRPLRKRILANLKGLRDLDMVTVLEAEIVVRLLEGRRTAGELAEEIFDVRRESESFHSHYMRVCRALHSLQRRGYVATRLFGRDRPYRLTDYAISRLARLEDEKPPRLIPRKDAAIYTMTIAASCILLSARAGLLSLGRQGFMILFTLGVFLSGIALTRFVEMNKKVW